MFVGEDLPEEWIDWRKILKPIFNAAKRKENLKDHTHMSKDKLIINGKSFSAGPELNFLDANSLIDLPSTCQRTDPASDVTMFLGMHSVFSNLHLSAFTVDNVHYSSAEQMIQSSIAGLFNDDVTQAKIMNEHNPYKIKKLGSRVKGYKEEK